MTDWCDFMTPSELTTLALLAHVNAVLVPKAHKRCFKAEYNLAPWVCALSRLCQKLITEAQQFYGTYILGQEIGLFGHIVVVSSLVFLRSVDRPRIWVCFEPRWFQMECTPLLPNPTTTTTTRCPGANTQASLSATSRLCLGMFVGA